MNQKSSNGVARKRRVFIVDDHPLVRDGLANLINQQSDLTVCGEAEDSAGAIAGIESSRPDVALIDISLKNESGLELVKTLQTKCPQVTLIVLSMHDEELYAERALHAGLAKILTAIRRVLTGDIYVSDRVVNSMARRMSSRKSAAATPVERLSDRELEIFRLLGQGRTPSQIAEDLRLSLKTVQAYCARAKEKFGVTSLTELLRAAIRWEDAMHVK